MKTFVKIGIGISILSSLWACREDSDFSEIPELFYRDFQVSSNAEGEPIAVWKLGFTDGDGNIGVRNDKDSNNFIVSGFSFIDGQTVQLPALTGYRIPASDNISSRSGIEGEFRFELKINSYSSAGIDSMYLEGYVVDRSFNESNSIQTPVFLY
jgi:hypothetical protein